MFLLRRFCLVLLSSLFFISPVIAHENWDTSRPDAHAPIGVMGEHVHKAGEFMVSYRFMQMRMEDNYRGTDKLSDSEVHNNFVIAPEQMEMDMHMLGAMYAPTDDLTMMFMAPYVYKRMDHVRRSDGATFRTESKGFGDVSLSGLYRLHQDETNQLLFNFGMSFPTGSISKRDQTLISPSAKLPFPMQLGSGTHDLLPGLTYTGQSEDWSWGSQLRSTIRLGRNRFKYKLGDRAGLTGWITRKLNDWASTSFRLDAQMWGNISGRDQDIAPSMMVQTSDPDNQGGKRVDLHWGLNLIGEKGFWKGHRLAFEIGVPIYQNLDGPQLGTDLIYTIGYQKAW